MPWIWYRLSSYRLRLEPLEAWLHEKFGDHDFYIRIEDEYYMFWIPRKLSYSEKNEIDNLRVAYDDEPYDGSLWPTGTESKTSFVPFVTHSTSGNIVLPSDQEGQHIPRYEIIDEDNDGGISTLESLCKRKISEGESCEVFEALAYRVDPVEVNGPPIIKIAIKKLKHDWTGDGKREHDALRLIKTRHHPNVVELISTFQRPAELHGVQSIAYNFVFPCAPANLKQLLRGSIASDMLCNDIQDLWTQFEGLADALAYLHDECGLAHTDLKPSNILLYPCSARPSILAKITDFGLATNLKGTSTWQLGTIEAKSALRYDPPELKRYVNEQSTMAGSTKDPNEVRAPQPVQFQRGDIWKLGSVFTEILTFLLQGTNGLVRFRKSITTKSRGITSGVLRDIRFDDGLKVKPEVLAWLSRIMTIDPRAYELAPLIRSMLDEETKRPSAATVSKALKESSLCLYFDGKRFIRFANATSLPTPSWRDLWKEKVEKWLGVPVDWWPLRKGWRTCPFDDCRVFWEWSGISLYVDVPAPVAHNYRAGCRPISAAPSPQSSQTRPLQLGIVQGQPSSGSQNSPSQGWQQPNPSTQPTAPSPNQSQALNNSPTSNVSSNPLKVQDIHWCVDKSWTQPKTTILCRIKDAHTLDDNAFCMKLVSEYNRVRGWRARLFSWKTCLGIEFIEFGCVWTGKDQVSPGKQGLPEPPKVEYDYEMMRSKDMHMRIAAKQVLCGMHNPNCSINLRETIDLIPKKKDASLLLLVGSQGWGIYARQGFSLLRFLAWIAVVTFAGVGFFVFWLVKVDMKDLQNAIIPFSFLATMLMMALAVPQVWDIA